MHSQAEPGNEKSVNWNMKDALFLSFFTFFTNQFTVFTPILHEYFTVVIQKNTPYCHYYQTIKYFPNRLGTSIAM